MVNGHLLKFQFKWIFSENIDTTKEKLPFKPPFSVLGVMAFMGHFPFPFTGDTYVLYRGNGT